MADLIEIENTCCYPWQYKNNSADDRKWDMEGNEWLQKKNENKQESLFGNIMQI